MICSKNFANSEMSNSLIRQDYIDAISDNINNGEIISFDKMCDVVYEEKFLIFNTIIKKRYMYFTIMQDSNSESLIIGNINMYEKKNITKQYNFITWF